MQRCNTCWFDEGVTWWPVGQTLVRALYKAEKISERKVRRERESRKKKEERNQVRVGAAFEQNSEKGVGPVRKGKRDAKSLNERDVDGTWVGYASRTRRAKAKFPVKTAVDEERNGWNRDATTKGLYRKDVTLREQPLAVVCA